MRITSDRQRGGIFLLRLPLCFFSRMKYITRSDTLCYSPPFCPICLTWRITNTVSRSWHATCQTLVEQLPQRPAFFNTTVFCFFSVSKDSFGNRYHPCRARGNLSSVICSCVTHSADIPGQGPVWLLGASQKELDKVHYHHHHHHHHSSLYWRPFDKNRL